jgi:hypothetical protein
MSDVLMPDDLFFLSKIFLLEQPLLQLEQIYGRELGEETAAVVNGALNAWNVFVDRLPTGLQLDRPQPGAEETQRQGYVLHDPRGRQLASLYLQEDREGDLDWLKACHRMLAQADAGQADDEALPEVLSDVEKNLLKSYRLSTTGWVEAFGRVLAVMQLSVPHQLKQSLKLAAPAGRTVGVTLNAEQAAEYRTLAGEIVCALSSGHPDAYNTHRALYGS